MDTFDPLQAPSAGSGGPESTVRLIENQFGDGYRQTLKDGLNAIEDTLPLTWNACPTSTKEYIRTFMRAHAGRAFYYRAPGEAVARKWDCKTWKVVPGSGAYWMVSCTLRERFDLAT